MSVVAGIDGWVVAAVTGEQPCGYAPTDWLRAELPASGEAAGGGDSVTVETRLHAGRMGSCRGARRLGGVVLTRRLTPRPPAGLGGARRGGAAWARGASAGRRWLVGPRSSRSLRRGPRQKRRCASR